MSRLAAWAIRWYEAQPREQVCYRCRKEGDRAYVQPQIPRKRGGESRGALCIDCITAINEGYREQRKAERGSRPKCERCGVWPFTFYAGDQRFEVCGRCLKEIRREIARVAAGAGALALFTPASDFMSLAGWKNPRPGRAAMEVRR